MKFYNFFLKLYGLKFPFDIKDNNDEIEFNEIIINVGSNGELQQMVDYKKNNCLNNETKHKIIGIAYFIFISFLLSWQCIYSIIASIIYSDGRYFTSTIYSYMYLGQFISGVIFYNGKYFDDAIKKLKDYHTIMLIMFIISNVISILLGLISIILLIDGYTIINYTNLYNGSNGTGKIFLIITLFVENIYIYNIFFINIIVFAIILHYQRINISLYLDKMDKIIDGNIHDMTITSVIDEFSKMQSYYKKSVDNLNNIFTSVTSIGIIGAYFVIINIGNTFVSIFSYINLALFLIIEAVYIISINKINDNKKNIRVLIGSATFVSKFLNRKLLSPLYGDIYNENFQKARNFDSIINKLNDNDFDKKVDLIKNMTFRSILLSTENGIELDWIILYNKLSENWQQFTLFGYDFDDTQIIQKLFVLVFGFSAILRLNFKFGL
ncbi:hypothetical protein Indivirus_1_41 [Indivirus ILV1]|uniref:Uncharacterized protein n=1 Tax=Indivirus ILV1 TaxID=1977633 RepID=A0A1V0SCN4_9VIRU|nr:hypothetical protein Indivirus_1_41 [Indivirus ILV1]